MVRKGSKKEEGLKHKARRLSIKEGIFWATGLSFGRNYIPPFAIAINASNSIVALISSFVGLLGPLSQMFSSKLMEKQSRKKIMRTSRLFSTLVWLPIILIAILFHKGIVVEILPLALLLFFSLYIILGNLSFPPWFSWMGDLVDKKYRGRWFSKRNLIGGLISAVLAIVSAIFLDFFKDNGWLMFGFIIFFTLAILARFGSWSILKKVYEPKMKIKKESYFSFGDFLIKSPKTNFGKFTLFRSAVSFADYITTPLIAIYILRTLEFSYTYYMLIGFTWTIFSILFLNLWGKIADKYGNYKILCMASITIPIAPILWVLNPNPIYLAIIPPFISGMSWSAFNLATSNFVYDNVEKQKRGLAVSYFNMLNGVGIFLGAGLAAILLKYLKTSFIEPIIFIFFLGAIIRMIVMFFGIPHIREVRKTKRLHGIKELEEVIVRVIKPTRYEEAHEINSIKGYLEEK